MLVVVLGNVVLTGHFTLAAASVLAALVAVVLSYLLHEFVARREHAELLDKQNSQLKAVRARLEQSLATAAAMNARLNQREALYKGLVDAQGDAIFRRAADSRLTYGNEAFFKLFGLKQERAVGQPFAPELHPDSRTQSFGGFAGLDAGRTCTRYDQHVRTAYGWRWIAWEDFAIRDHRGNLVEVQSVGRDITERKALEDALTEARDRAEAGSRAKSGFLATMSHEIRTPMNGVLGMARLLRETDLRAEQRTYVEAISESGETLLSLIGDILDFSKIESGTFSLDDDEVELRQLVESVVELSSPRAHDKDIELVAVVDADVPQAIRVDAVRLRQVLTNLIGNAVKFTERGGVQIRAQLVDGRERRFVRFEVQDTGVGVPIEKRDEIFNEFVQGDSTHARKFGGTGLGLAISRKLVEAMGGKIGIEGVVDGGSQFWFTVPALIVRPAAATDDFPLSGISVGIVTRNRVLRAGLAEQVEAAGGKVATMGGKGAIRPDILLVDAGTRAEPKPPGGPDAEIPTIVLVTSRARSSLPKLRAKGFAGYLIKPVRQSSLIERLTLRLDADLPESAGQTQLSPGADARRRPATEQAETGAPRGLKFLLAEDNPINALLTRELLRRRGHKVTEVTSGEAAVKAMATGTFDIVLTDIHMPGMDGIEAAQAIRANETASGSPRTPIVALTADALETGMRACKDAGMDGFLTKPIDPAQLDEMLVILFPSATPIQNAAA
jgi:PAS domain S-box-containing protein